MMQVYQWDKAGFENAYWRYAYKLRGCGTARPHWCKCNDRYISYSREFFETNAMFTERAIKIINKLSLPQGSEIFVVGCALGYLQEELNRMGMVAYGCDSSQYIHSIKNKEKATVDIIDADIGDANFISKLDKTLGKTKFDCVITEDVLPSYNSYTSILANCESLLKDGVNRKNIVHVVETAVGAPMVSRTLVEWTAIRFDHTWLNGSGDGDGNI